LFFSRAKKDIKNPEKWADMTFGAYLDENRTGRAFVDTILLPMMSVTCTCNYASVLSYPADIMLGYVTCGVTEFGIMSAEKGVDDIVTRLLDGVNLLTGSAISEVMAAGEQLRITVANGDVQFYDQVVVATQAHQAAAMLSGFNTQKKLLETVPIEMSEMSVHTDTDILPYSDAPLSPVSYHIPKDRERAEVSVDLTKAIPRFGGQERVFQTWNPIRKISPNKDLARAKFTRPLVTRESRKAITSLRKHQQRDGNRLWFTGSYMADKIPLLDAAVDSTILVAEQLGVEIPWKTDPSA
jgi:predicted NAD/FAD-binding protein